MATRRSRSSERGVTLIEASIVLTTVALLTSILAPSVVGYLEQSRRARVRQDQQAIGDAIHSFFEDTGERQFLINASNGAGDDVPPTRQDANRVNLLVSDGDVPVLATAVSADTLWTNTVNGLTVDTLSNHLTENAPGELASNRYRNPTDVTIVFPGGSLDFARSESSGFNAPQAWRGPYLRGPVSSDPWGNRYAVNVAFLDPAPTAVVTGITAGFGPTDYPRLDVFVLSAGADEEIDTRVAQDGAVAGDDDYVHIVTGHAK